VKRVALLGFCLLAAGCGSHPASLVVHRVQRHCTAGIVPLGSARLAYAAVARGSLSADARPGGRVLSRFGKQNVNGVPTIFGVRAERANASCAATWFRVQLPIKPNGIVGWVRARDVEIGSVATRIVIDESQRRLTLYRDGVPTLTTTVAVGSPATPTPTGSFYVNQRLLPENPNGPYGPAAIGVSAYSNVLTGWAQGGPIAIHGTDDPASIGRAVSNGCVRVRNEVVLRLFHQVLAGTPVIIRP